jgi:hypothetical protein
MAYDVHYMLEPRRILEIYVNVAQFGTGIHGVCAASWWVLQPAVELLDFGAVRRARRASHQPGHVDRGPNGSMDFSRGFAEYDAGNPYGRASYGFAHEAPPGEQDCSTMPAAVTDLLVARGYTVPQPPDVEALRAAG